MFHWCSNKRGIVRGAASPRSQARRTKGFEPTTRNGCEPRTLPRQATPMKKPEPAKCVESGRLERNTGFEPTTFALARRRPTPSYPLRLIVDPRHDRGAQCSV